ncbi:hypothetical protein PHAVU_007G006800 [Phaseolus vulgaris]|uniref:Uncharacterized protein n=1 Tax=Phaseolus vulgaris TaxID=3885 RepID=V7BA36_PHAVU|nr:hypothetical protein PHAVU_007G006800g [Phaseolus vulgaris]ESW14664.1 hypothetical protein PHAVU_007G006800g [Phaseolus vulgaris]
MSQHQNQNLPLVLQSGAGVKPFSIRQYVLACRHRNISQNWPYEEKHLQLCLKSGLMEKEMLPPLEQGKASHDEPLKGFSKMHSPNDNNYNKETDSCNAEVPQDIDDECNYKVSNHPHEEGNYSNHQNACNDSAKCTLSSSTNFHDNSPLLPPSKAVKYKRKRGKGKCKKRFMVDILAVAQHSTLEEIDGVKKFCYAETVVVEGFMQKR